MRRWGLAAVAAGCALHRYVRGVPGARSPVRGVRARGGRGATRTRGCVLAGGHPDASRGPCGADAASSGHRRVRSSSPVSGPSNEIPAVSADGGRARLAAQHRDEHAAQDLSVPPERHADRRDAPAHAHASPQRRDRHSDARDGRRASARYAILGGARTPDRERGERGATRARHLAETKYSYEAYLARTREACAHLRRCTAGRAPDARMSPARSRGARSNRTTATRTTPTRTTSRQASTRCAAAARSAGCWPRRRSGCCADFLRDAGRGADAASTSARGLAVPRSPWRCAARASPAWTRRRRCSRWRADGRRRPAAVAGARFDARGRARAAVRRSMPSTRPCRVARADAHARAGGTGMAELCRVSRSRVVFDYPSARSAAALQAAAPPAARRRLGRQTEAYRVFRPAATDAAPRGGGLPRVTGVHRQFVLPIAVHKGGRVAALHRDASEARVQRAVGLEAGRLDRRSRSWRSGAGP